jgi:hypothetical protein
MRLTLIVFSGILLANYFSYNKKKNETEKGWKYQEQYENLDAYH